MSPNPADYRLLVSAVIDDRGTLTEGDLAARVGVQKTELARVREMLREDWTGFPKGCDAISLTVIWSDPCNLKPGLLRLNRDGVLPVEIEVPVAALMRSLREERYGPLLRWLMLSTLLSVIDHTPTRTAPAALVAALGDAQDYSEYVQTV